MAFKHIPGNTVEVPEIPYKDNLILDPEKTALIIIDMQNDFVKDGGSLVVPAANDSVLAIRQLMDQARSAGARIQT